MSNRLLSKFLPSYIIGLGIYQLFLSFLFINKYLPAKKLAQMTLTSYIQLLYQLFCNGSLTGILGTSRYISTWWL